MAYTISQLTEHTVNINPRPSTNVATTGMLGKNCLTPTAAETPHQWPTGNLPFGGG